MVDAKRHSFIPGILICLFIVQIQLAGQTNELGNYPLNNFSPRDYNALDQNWCAVQDQRGIMYFGNHNGVLEYDGVNWRSLAGSDGSPVHSMAMDPNGRIYFGAENEFGYLHTNTKGQLEYELLSELLNDDQDFFEVWGTHLLHDAIVFQCYHNLFIWRNDSLNVIASEREINESYLVGDRLFISYLDASLGMYRDGKLKALQISGMADLGRISGMVALGEDRMLIITEQKGFYELIPDAPGGDSYRLRKIETPSDLLFTRCAIYNAIKLPDGRISLGTWGHGVIILDESFHVEKIIDKESGLQDEVIQGQFIDERGNLWLSLSSGISRIEVHSGLTHFGDESGLEGTIQSLARCNERVYASSNNGLYFMSGEAYDASVCRFQRPVFQMINSFDMECWQLIPFHEPGQHKLIVITNDEVFWLDKNHRSGRVCLGYAYSLLQSDVHPDRLFIGLEQGLVRIRKEGEKWVEENDFPDIELRITHICEAENGVLWLGTETDGMYRVSPEYGPAGELMNYTLEHFTDEQGLPEGPFITIFTDGQPHTATNKGMCCFHPGEAYFYPDSLFGGRFADGTSWIHRIKKRNDDRIYMVTFSEEPDMKFEAGYLEKTSEGDYEWNSRPFRRVAEEQVNALLPEADGIAWFGGSGGLYRFDENYEPDLSKPFNVYIRSVSRIEGELLYGGAYSDENNVQSMIQTGRWKLSLPYRENSLEFLFSAQPGEDEEFNKYSFFLEGNDSRWSDWTGDSKKEYTNLHEGAYTFHIKAMNIYGQESNEATYEFVILAPWFRTVWAYIAYLVLAILIVYAIVTVYTRRLRAIIRERTAEVVAQKEVIEQKNDELMDSIQYAEKIQRALIPPEDDLAELDLDGFILFKPLNIVSGDFYWMGKKNGVIITIAADCTGHGVPGAFMSMLGVAFLNNIIGAKGIVSADAILNELRAEVISALKQKGHAGEQKDGMDLALHVLDLEHMNLEFAGANNPLIIIRDQEIIQLKADRMPIGIHERADQPFQKQEMALKKGDVLYTFSDGFQDQFGGPKNKKFMVKRLKELFLEIHREPMSRQKEILDQTFHDWTVPYDAHQIDDVIVIGIRV